MRQVALGLLAATSFFLADCAQDAASSEAARPVTVFALRHAEKRVDDPQNNDPELTPAGEKRAEALAKLLGSSGVTHLFSSEFKRTRNTLAPLAETVGLQVQEISGRDLSVQIDALQSLTPGSIAVVAGHSNTIPQLVAGLGGEIRDLTPRGLIEDNTYDRLFVVTLPVDEHAATQTVELRY